MGGTANGARFLSQGVKVSSVRPGAFAQAVSDPRAPGCVIQIEASGSCELDRSQAVRSEGGDYVPGSGRGTAWGEGSVQSERAGASGREGRVGRVCTGTPVGATGALTPGTQ